MDSNLLGMLGLARRGGMLAVGEEPAQEASQQKDARLLLLAADSAPNTERRIQRFAEEGCCLWARAPFTKAELGNALGRASCAILAVTDTGFAAAIARRLADGDSTCYGDLAAKLDVKAKRAAERKADRRIREKAGERAVHSSGSPTAEKRGKETASIEKRRLPAGKPSRRNSPHADGTPNRGRSTGNFPHAGGTPNRGRSTGNFHNSGNDRRGFGTASHSEGGRSFSRAPASSHSGRPFSGSKPVKKGKGSFRKRTDGK